MNRRPSRASPSRTPPRRLRLRIHRVGGTGRGNLNDKDREKAMQEIGREFPHDREVVEEYFRPIVAERNDCTN